jgi:uncharacterized protein (DUF58 family)
MLFDLSFLHRLKLLNIITKRHFRGEKIGHRKSPNRGASAEFAEYKDYLPGDDLRFLDWNLLARLDKLYIKKFHNEEELPISILLDTSTSMGFGTPPKFDHARRLAAAIAFIAMQHQDEARIFPFGQALDQETEGGVRPAHIHRLMGFLEKKQPAGASQTFEQVVAHFLARSRRSGLVFVLTDGMAFDDLRTGLKHLAHRRFEVQFLHVLAPDEMTPDLAGLTELIDGETGSRLNVHINNQVLTVYEEVLRDWMDDLRSTLYQLGMGYHRSVTSTPFESTLLALFGRGGSRHLAGQAEIDTPGETGR